MLGLRVCISMTFRSRFFEQKGCPENIYPEIQNVHKSRRFFLYDGIVPDPLSTSFSQQLKAFRGELSYAQFALKIGISKSLAHKLETSGEGTTLKTVYKIACALGCSVEEVLGRDAVRKKRSRRG